MANNRMMVVCNKCFPDDDHFTWDDFQEGRVIYMAKWYPVGPYYCNGDEAGYADKFYRYLETHAHSPEEDGKLHQENPVRLTYESWVVDPKPLMKKWEFNRVGSPTEGEQHDQSH
jgi:hypothetical protein